MNWVGGARSRIKFQGDRKLQKEFFERKKINLKCDKRQTTSHCHTSKSKKKVSQDLVALHTVSNTSIRAGTSPRNVKVQHIDLDHRRPGSSLAKGISEYSGKGLRVHRAPENVHLPFSPDFFPSKLQLRESISPSANAEETHGKGPFKRKCQEPSLTLPQEAHSSFITRPDPCHSTLEADKNEERIFQTPKRLRTHSPPHLPTSKTVQDRFPTLNTSIISEKTNQCFQPSTFSTSLSQTNTPKSRNPWTEEFNLFDMKRIHEKFQSPLCPAEGTVGRSHSKVDNTENEESWVPYKYPFSQRRVSSKDTCSSGSSHTLKTHRNEQLSQETPIFHKQDERYGNPQPSLNTMWARNDPCTDPKHWIALSPIKVSDQLTSTMTIHPSTLGSVAESPIVENAQRHKKLNSGPTQTMSYANKITLPSFGDQFSTTSKLKSNSQTSSESCKAEKLPSHPEHPAPKPSLFLDPEESERQQNIRQLWMSEDFQRSPYPSDRNAGQGTPQISLSAYTQSFQKPLVSKWESFLDSPQKQSAFPHLSPFSVPHTPNLWKASSSFLSGSRAKESTSASDASALLKPISETSTTCFQEAPEVYHRSRNSWLAPVNAPLSLHDQTGRQNRNMWTSSSHASAGHSDLDRRIHEDLRVLHQPELLNTKNRTDDNDRMGMTTPATSDFKQQTLGPPTSILWSKDKNMAEEVLQEFELLKTDSDDEDKRTGGKRKTLWPERVALVNSLEKPVIKAYKEHTKRQAEHGEIHDDMMHGSHDVKSACMRSTDRSIAHVDETASLVSQELSVAPSSTTVDEEEQSENSNSQSDTDSDGHDISVLESKEVSNADSDFQNSIRDVVQAIVHKVIMAENKRLLTDTKRTDSGVPNKIIWSSETDLQRSAGISTELAVVKPQMVLRDPVHHERPISPPRGVNPEPQRVSVHVQTDWSLITDDFSSGWLGKNPGKNMVDKGTQWKSPVPWPYSVTTRLLTVTAQSPSLASLMTSEQMLLSGGKKPTEPEPTVSLVASADMKTTNNRIEHTVPQERQSPRRMRTNPRPSSSLMSIADCQVSAVKICQNLSEMPKINNPPTNSMGISLAHGLKPPNISNANASSEEIDPQMDPVDLSSKKNLPSQMFTAQMSVEKKKTHERSTQQSHMSLNVASDSLKMLDISIESVFGEKIKTPQMEPLNLSTKTKESPYIFRMNLQESARPYVSVEIPVTPFNASAVNSKLPDIFSESAYAVKMKIPERNPMNISIQENESPQIFTGNGYTEDMKITNVSTATVATTEDRNKLKLQPSGTCTVTECRSLLPQCQEEHTKSVNQPMTPQSVTSLPSPDQKCSEMVTQSDQRTELFAHDGLSHCQNTSAQMRVNRSSISAVCMNGMLLMDKDHCSATKLTTTTNSCIAQSSSLKSPSESPERTAAGCITPPAHNETVNKDEQPACSISDTDHHLVNNGVATTTSLVIKDHHTKLVLMPEVELDKKELPVHVSSTSDRVANYIAATTVYQAATETHPEPLNSSGVTVQEETHVSSSEDSLDVHIASSNVVTAASFETMDHNRKSVMSPCVALHSEEQLASSALNFDHYFLSHEDSIVPMDHHLENVSSHTGMALSNYKIRNLGGTGMESDSQLLSLSSQTSSSSHRESVPTQHVGGEQKEVEHASRTLSLELASTRASSYTGMDLKSNVTPDRTKVVMENDSSLLLLPSQTGSLDTEKESDLTQSTEAMQDNANSFFTSIVSIQNDPPFLLVPSETSFSGPEKRYPNKIIESTQETTKSLSCDLVTEEITNLLVHCQKSISSPGKKKDPTQTTQAAQDKTKSFPKNLISEKDGQHLVLAPSQMSASSLQKKRDPIQTIRSAQGKIKSFPSASIPKENYHRLVHSETSFLGLEKNKDFTQTNEDSQDIAKSLCSDTFLEEGHPHIPSQTSFTYTDKKKDPAGFVEDKNKSFCSTLVSKGYPCFLLAPSQMSSTDPQEERDFAHNIVGMRLMQSQTSSSGSEKSNLIQTTKDGQDKTKSFHSTSNHEEDDLACLLLVTSQKCFSGPEKKRGCTESDEGSQNRTKSVLMDSVLQEDCPCPAPSLTRSAGPEKREPAQTMEDVQDTITKSYSVASVPEADYPSLVLSVKRSSGSDKKRDHTETNESTQDIITKSLVSASVREKDCPLLIFSQTSYQCPDEKTGSISTVESKQGKLKSVSSTLVPNQDFRVRRSDGTEQRESKISFKLNKTELDVVTVDGDEEIFFTPKESYSSP